MSKIEDLVGYISFPSGFKLLSEVPLDARYCGEGQEFLQSIVDIGAAYPGLRVFLIDENKFYTYMKDSNEEYNFVVDSIQFTPEQLAVLNSGITAAKVAEFENKYDKPAEGIPETDLDSTLATKIDEASSNASSAITNIATIEGKISLQASASNKVLSASEVQTLVNNSLGRSLASNPAGDPFATKAALDAGPWYYGAYSVTRMVNDQASVFDSNTVTTTIYVYDGNGWVFKSQTAGGLNTEQTQAVNAVINSGFTAEDWTASQTKLSGIENGAEVNVLEGVQVNEVDQIITSKKVNISVPTQPSDIGAQPTLVSGTNIKTINNGSILGSGNLDLVTKDGDNQTITSGLTLTKNLNLPSVNAWPANPSSTKAATEAEVGAGIDQIAKSLIASEKLPSANLEGTIPTANIQGNYPSASVGSATNAANAAQAVRLAQTFGIKITGKATAALVSTDGGPDQNDNPAEVNLNVTALSIQASDVPTLNQDTTGNAGTATKLATARKLRVDLSGTNNVTFDGSADVEDIPVTGRLTSLGQLPQVTGDSARHKVLTAPVSNMAGDIILALLDKTDVGLDNVINELQAKQSDFLQLVQRVSDLEQRGLYLGAFNTYADLPATLLIEDTQDPGTYIRNPALPNGASTGDFAIVRADETHSGDVSNYGIISIASDTLGTITWQYAYSYHIDISGKIDKVIGATENNFPQFDSNGGIKNSSYGPSSFATAAQGTKADRALQPEDVDGSSIIISSNKISLNQTYKDYLDEVTYLTPDIMSFSLSPSSTSYEVSTSARSITGFNHYEKNISNISSLKIKNNRTSVETSVTPVSSQTPVEYEDSFTLSAAGNTQSYTLTSIDTKGGIKTKTVTISAYAPSYAGGLASPSISSSDLPDLTRYNKTSFTNNDQVNNITLASSKYVYFVTSGNNISKITDKDTGIDVEYTQLGNLSTSLNGVTLTYKVYRTVQLLPGTYNYIINKT